MSDVIDIQEELDKRKGKVLLDAVKEGAEAGSNMVLITEHEGTLKMFSNLDVKHVLILLHLAAVSIIDNDDASIH
jgi:hypothetical protein